jgi:N utilization substance protein A
VYEGIVEIKSVAREAGARSKVAVATNDPQVDPVGACVGHRGARVQAIVDELRGEKIDIVRYSEEVVQYLKAALSPARVQEVVLQEDGQSATIIAPDDQLSLAIGRRGQNVRLAAQLTGWKIDIRSQAQWEAEKATMAPAPAAETRIRIYELARELGVESRDLVEILQDESIEVTSHASTVTGEQADLVRELLLGGSGTLEDLEAGTLPIDLG